MFTTMRSTLAVIAGYLVFGVSAVLLFQWSGRNPHAAASMRFMVLATLYGIGFAAFGGFIAVKLSGDRRLFSSIALAILIDLGAIISLVTSPAGQAHWSQLAVLVFMSPAAIAGGFLGGHRAGRRS